MRKVKLELAPFIILGHAQFCCTGCPNMFRMKENLKIRTKVHEIFRILLLDKISGTC